MKRGPFQTAVVEVAKAQGLDLEATNVCILLDRAYEIDRLRAELLEAAKRVALDLERLARDVRLGSVYSSNPLSGSSVADIPILNGRIYQAQVDFGFACEMLFGRDGRKAVTARILQELEGGAK